MVRRAGITVALVASTALALAGAVVSPSHAEEPPATIELATTDHGPVETAVIQNSFGASELADGRPVMLVQGGTVQWKTVIGVIDPMTGEKLHEVRVPEITQSLSPVTGPDGKLYIPGYPGNYNGTNLMSFDPKTMQVENLGQGIPSETHLSRTQFVGNTLWAGTFPNGHVQSYDITTGEYTDHGRVDENEWYARSIAHDGDHTVYVGTEGTGRIIKWDLATGERTDLPKPPDMAPSDYTVMLLSYQNGFLFGRYGGSSMWHAYDAVAGEWVDSLKSNASMPTSVDPATGQMYFASDKLYRFDFGSRSFVDEGWGQHLTSANAGAGIALMDLKDPEWPGLSVVGQGRSGGIWRYNPTTKHGQTLPDADLPRSGQSVPAMHLGPDGKPYFGKSFNSGSLVRFDPATKEYERQSPFTTQQLHNFFTASDGTMYMGSYTNAGFLRYNPAEPYQWGTNPRLVHDFDDDGQDRVFGLTEANGKIIAGTTGQRGKPDGVLGVYDVTTDEMTTYRAPLPGHQITALTTIGDVVYGGTSIITPGADPVATESKIFAFDPETGTVQWQVSPLPGNATVAELVPTDDGKLWGLTNDDVAFLFDPLTRTVLNQVKVGPGGSNDGYGVLRRGSDGHLYGATSSGSMFRLDPATGKLWKFEGRGVSIDQASDGSLYWTDGVSLFSGTMIDRTAPETTADFTGNRRVLVTIGAGDDISGVDTIEYRIDGQWITYSEPVQLDRRPGLRLEYRATDTAGNTSEVKTLKLDPGPPGRTPGGPGE